MSPGKLIQQSGFARNASFLPQHREQVRVGAAGVERQPEEQFVGRGQFFRRRRPTPAFVSCTFSAVGPEQELERRAARTSSVRSSSGMRSHTRPAVGLAVAQVPVVPPAAARGRGTARTPSPDVSFTRSTAPRLRHVGPGDRGAHELQPLVRGEVAEEEPQDAEQVELELRHLPRPVRFGRSSRRCGGAGHCGVGTRAVARRAWGGGTVLPLPALPQAYRIRGRKTIHA